MIEADWPIWQREAKTLLGCTWCPSHVAQWVFVACRVILGPDTRT